MRLSRRQFNRCAVAMSGAAAMPRVPLPVRNGSDDAYTAVISELARVEEAAHASGATLGPGSGAVTATGRQLEAFVGHLDMQISPFESAAQVYRELRAFLKRQAEEIASNAGDAMKRHASEAMKQKVSAEPENHPDPDEDMSVNSAPER
ncbi:MAG: hypothetical protein MPJ78_08845 [Hyphomicrobiaceae bacterium]|nr:hypothetical protein [Hyphomicrobiaceae bacterium]